MSIHDVTTTIGNHTADKQAVCALGLRCIVVASCSMWRLKQQILTEHSETVRPFLFPFNISKYNLIYSE